MLIYGWGEGWYFNICKLRGLYIVACQRGGVSNKPPWALGSDKTWGQGSFDPFTGGLSNSYLQKIKKMQLDVDMSPTCFVINTMDRLKVKRVLKTYGAYRSNGP